MDVQASLKGYRISAFKARLVADQVRGKGVEDALNLLDLSPKKFARPLAKLVRSQSSFGRGMFRHCHRASSRILRGREGRGSSSCATRFRGATCRAPAPPSGR